MNETLDLETLYRQEKNRWLKEEAPRRSFRDLLTGSVPYWIILVALVLYGLSAPHTAGVFDKLTPGWGWIAPIAVEFGLLYAAFRRRLAHEEHQPLPWTLLALEALLFLTAMLVNGAGSFTSVIDAAGLKSLSFSAIVEAFGQLPATSQAALVMAFLSAFIIPIGALVTGDGLAALALERHEDRDFREDRWQEVAFTVVYRAAFVRYMQQGMSEKDARQKATVEVKGYLGSPSVRLLSAPSGQRRQAEQSGHPANGRGETVKGQVRAYLAEHPEMAQMSVNQALLALHAAGVQAGRTTVGEVLAERNKLKLGSPADVHCLMKRFPQ